MFTSPSSKFSSLLLYGMAISTLALSVHTSAFAQAIPSAADIDRVKPNQQPLTLQPMESGIAPNDTGTGIAQPPEDAKKIKLLLKNVKITGSTIYDEAEFKKLYAADINHEITLDKIWEIAAGVTKKYRADGYFLSRAYVPVQEIADGTIQIGIVEGYIGDVNIDASFANHRAVQDIIRTITSEKPITVKTLEREHLLLSDLPGMSNYQGILTPMHNGPEGAVQLLFKERPLAQKNYYVGFDNMGSRYLGPYEISGSWNGQIIPLQNTYLSATSSLPTKELAAVNLTHQIPIWEDLKFEMTAGYTRAEPGYTIKARDIESKAINAGIALNYQMIRQRQENLSFKISLDARNSDSTIIGTDLTTDKIRAVRLAGTYDKSDEWFGYNVINMTLSRGLDALGASQKGDLNLSRDGAKPDFTKAEIQYSRLQGLTTDIAAVLTANAQKSSGSLFSSEEFGFGGQSLGRAYDPSEISGDDGLAGGLELRYQSLPQWKNTQFQPYVFYDIGKVWNQNAGQEKTLSASSTGLGFRFQHQTGVSGLFQISLPLTKSADAPLYGTNGSGPQIGFQIGYSF